ncbi:hypothetical protein GCM10027072_24820 [Streptomyces bullii]
MADAPDRAVEATRTHDSYADRARRGARLAPGFTHVAVAAYDLVNGASSSASSVLLDDAARRLAVRLDGRAPHEDPHMAAWR